MCTTLLVKRCWPCHDGVQRTWTRLESAWKSTNISIIFVKVITIITAGWLLPLTFVSQILAEWLHIMFGKKVLIWNFSIHAVKMWIWCYFEINFTAITKTCVPLLCWFMPLFNRHALMQFMWWTFFNWMTWIFKKHSRIISTATSVAE